MDPSDFARMQPVEAQNIVVRGDVIPGIMVCPRPGLQTGCFWCGDFTDILLFGQLRDESNRAFKQREVTAASLHETGGSNEPCAECAEIMRRGICLMEVVDDKRPTGRYWVLQPDAIPKIVPDQVMCYQIVAAGQVYIDRDAARRVGLYNVDIG